MNSCSVLKILKLPLISVFLVVLLLINTYALYSDIKIADENAARTEQRIKDSEWALLETAINENIQKAGIQNTFVSTKIQDGLKAAYGDNLDGLINDLDHPSTNSRLSQVLYNNLNGLYLNVDNDNNDPFVVQYNMRDQYGNIIGGIIFDKSINSASADEEHIRTWDAEISTHYNKVLAKDSISSIMNESNDVIFWEFLKSSNPNHKILTKSNDMDGLKEVFMTEGLKGLSTYEFLVPVYIKPGSDLFNVQKVNNLGYLSNVNQLIIVQGFNLVDQINANYKSQIMTFDNFSINTKSDLDTYKEYTIMRGVLSIIIIFTLFLSMVKIQNMLYEMSHNCSPED